LRPHQWTEKNSRGSEQYYSKRFAHDCNPFSRRHHLHSSQARQISRSSGSHALSSQQNSEEQVQGNSGPKQHAHRLSRDDRFRRNAHIRRDEAAGSSL